MSFVASPWPSDLPEPRVYKYLSSLLIRAIQKASPPDHDLSSSRQWSDLRDCLGQMSNIGVVQSLVRCSKFRDSLYHVLKGVERRDETQEREAIAKDQADIVSLLGKVIDSEEHKAEVVSLEDDEADSFMILAQTVLDDWGWWRRIGNGRPQARGDVDTSDHFFNFTEKFCRDVHKLLISLSLRCQKLPSSICIDGVKLWSKVSILGGSFADVYQGELGGVVVALKRPRALQDKESDQLIICKKVFQEALIWKSLEHRYVLPFLGIDAISFAPLSCIVSPWMRHGDILTFLKRSGPVQVDIDQLLLEITEGLNYLHQSKMIHGDLRGNNILIDDTRHVRLADFGLASIADVTKGARSTNNAGSPQWMAPELHFPDRFNLSFERTFASDVYALGCVYLEIYTRHPPFMGCSDAQLALKLHRKQRPSRPSSAQCLERTLPDDLWSLIEHCWSELPEDRPSAATALRDMEDICRGTVTTAKITCPLPETEVVLPTSPPTRPVSTLPTTVNFTEQRRSPRAAFSSVSPDPTEASLPNSCVVCYNQPKHSDGNIQHDFCSDACALKWNQTCRIRGCEEPVIFDGIQAFEVCITHHAMWVVQFPRALFALIMLF
ncbi:hypothetical protein JAAARDRAFT_589916 [Jaapia argillacea MUCL 33604]|uniref:Protein kinase domain-containing protein n=1 Tax=Jaapia argillacea MUCL 33604 TaxID=933084 RepID=A0A067P8Q3_9AGAM|nr:hypothetical protein JAAARDRAFT_589916 [Jaapia argillacea MUCL 33604]